MIIHRYLLRLLPAMLALLLLAAAPATAESSHLDFASASNDGALQGSVQAPKPADHASKKPRHGASLEEFFEIDDDAEQYFKLHPVVAPDLAWMLADVRARTASYFVELRTHRVCAAYPTGPPHA